MIEILNIHTAKQTGYYLAARWLSGNSKSAFLLINVPDLPQSREWLARIIASEFIKNDSRYNGKVLYRLVRIRVRKSSLLC